MVSFTERRGALLVRMFKAVFRLRLFVTPALRELLFLLGVWRPSTPPQDAVIRRFVEINKSYWESENRAGPGILVEGHLAEYGPNYLFRTGVAAKSVQAAQGGGDIVVVVNGFSYHWQSAIKAYASFGISSWAFLGRKLMLLGPFLFLFSSLLAAWRWVGVRTPQQLLDIHLGGIKIGDLIYDEVLRSTKQPTIHSIDWSVYKVMVRSWYYYYQYHLFLSTGRYRYYIATHTAYPEYGLLCRVALQQGIVVIETSDIQMSTYNSIGKLDLPTYHQGVNAEIRSDFASGNSCVMDRESRAKERLQRRLDSEIKHVDAQKAYSGRIYSKDDLRRQLDISSHKKIGFIAAHVFRDSPHLSSSMLYVDYYRWLLCSLECCAKSEGIDWLVKPHPASELYGEEGMVEALVQQQNASNIHLCPSDLNTSSLRCCADVILTVHGTIGLEFACLGVPTILSGTPFYSGFGFTHEPKTTSEYAQLVCNAASLPRLSETEVSMALQVFEVWERQFDWSNPIVTAEVMALVWGSGTERNLIRAYEVLTNNLQVTNPRQLKLWHFAASVASGARLHG